MEKVFVVIKNNLGTPLVRTFSHKNDAIRFAKIWYESTLDELEQFGHEIKGKGLVEDIGDGIIKTEIGDIEFELLETKIDMGLI